MAALAHRLCVGGIALVCFASQGCVQMPFYVPEVNVVPAVNAGGDGGDVHAFRVDLTDRVALKEGPPPNCVVRGENAETVELTKIAVSAGGTMPKQVALSWAHGWCYVGFWNYVNAYTSHSVAVRLYRPGYETIELKPGESPRDLRWTEATDLAAREKAVDDLLGVSPLEQGKTLSAEQQRRLQPGTKSAAHRESLLFAAREYERLARGAADAEPELRGRLVDKAERLKALAK
jgi:hypothetical protein